MTSSRKPSNKPSAKPAADRTRQKLPPGWDEARVRRVIDHYDKLTDEERAAEIEAAAEAADQTMISVPTDLVPAVLKMIARHRKAQKTA